MTHLNDTSSRIKSFSWNEGRKERRSQLTLLREYMRRSALWARSLKAGGWPFFDIAKMISPTVRAPEGVVEEVLDTLPEFSTYYTLRTIEWILHFSALKDSGVQLPGLPDPYVPLLIIYERGDVINMDGTGFIEIDGMAIRKGSMERFLDTPPAIETFDLAHLDGIDQNADQGGGMSS